MDEAPRAAALAAKLHSRYQPQAEADRYIEALNLRQDAGCFIVIEPGLGYLIGALKKFFPESRVVILHADNSFRGQGICPGIPAWYPDSDAGIQEFLESEIPETASVQIIEWKPAVRLFGDVYLGLVRESSEFIKRAAAGRRTGAAFGRRWVRNFFRNLMLLQNTLLYKAADVPIVITGSGPGLEAALPQILACREGIFVIAASSSLPALAFGGITPDLVITTDGGGWALLHLYACFRKSPDLSARPTMLARPTVLARPTMLAMTLTAAIPSQCSGNSVLPMSDGSLWQNMALNAAGIPSVYIPQRGTVTASALDLAMVLGGADIFLAGVDLAVRGIQSHARPYGFDHLFFGAACRFRPVYSQLFMRSSDIRSGGSHDIYAAWFNSRLASWPQRVFSLGSSNAALPVKALACGSAYGGGMFKVVEKKGSGEQRCALAAQTLIAALDSPQYAAELVSELAPLLFPSRQDVTAGEVAEALHGIAGKYWGQGSG